MAVCRYDPRVAAAAFVPHPDFTNSSVTVGASKKSGQNGVPTYASSGAVTSVFGALKQKSVKHRRNDGSNIGSDVSVPKPPPVRMASFSPQTDKVLENWFSCRKFLSSASSM